jgi:DNA-directed RNA polymerase specialized sigma24 family protein
MDEPVVVTVAMSGHSGGFDAFYRSEYSRIVRVMFGLTGRWALAEELAQESMLSAHRNWERVRTLDRPDLWLRRVAVNRAISAHRRLIAEIGALGRLRAASTSDLPIPADESIWVEIRRLPRRQSAAMVLWAVEGLTHAEIGETLDCSADTARTHIRRARETLRRTLEPKVER